MVQDSQTQTFYGPPSHPFLRGVVEYEEAFEGVKQSNTLVQEMQGGDAQDFAPQEFDRQTMRYMRLRKNVGMAAKLHSVALGLQNIRLLNCVMVTLTYKKNAWDSDHMGRYITTVRNWLDRRTKGAHKLRYLWVAELQKRGVIHYHCLFFLPHHVTLPKSDKCGWWRHGSTATEKAVAPIQYVLKYVSKFESKSEGLPRGARAFGVGGLAETDRLCRRWNNLPSFIKARASITDRWDRAVGGGWLERATGQIWASEWGVCLVTKLKLSIVKIRDHGRPLDVAGPFEWIDRRPA